MCLIIDTMYQFSITFSLSKFSKGCLKKAHPMTVDFFVPCNNSTFASQQFQRKSRFFSKTINLILEVFHWIILLYFLNALVSNINKNKHSFVLCFCRISICTFIMAIKIVILYWNSSIEATSLTEDTLYGLLTYT
jgi:hypothetical protein